MAFTSSEKDSILKYLGLLTFAEMQEVVDTWTAVATNLGQIVEDDIRSLITRIDKLESAIDAAYLEAGVKQKPGEVIDYKERIAMLSDRQRELCRRLGERMPQLSVLRDYFRPSPFSNGNIISG